MRKIDKKSGHFACYPFHTDWPDTMKGDQTWCIHILRWIKRFIQHYQTKFERSLLYTNQETMIWHTITRCGKSPDLPQTADADGVTFFQDGDVNKTAAGFNRHFLKSAISTITVTATEFCLLQKQKQRIHFKKIINKKANKIKYEWKEKINI